MRFSSTIVTLVACLYHHFGCTGAAPTREQTDEVLLGEVDIAVQNDNSNQVTLKPFEKKCVVDGKTYSHAHDVSYDANSRCICVAGNVYCFWHGLPSDAPTQREDDNVDGNKNWDSSSGPTDQPAYRNSSMPTESVDQSPPPAPAPVQSESHDLTHIYKNIDGEKSNEDDEDDNDTANEDYARDAGYEESTETIATTLTNNSPATPVTCVVLDRRYRVGEVLPHNTGNCVECSCGPEGHVVCAPRDCVSIVPHRDYREESFQIPVAGDLRGIDENF